MNNPLLDLMLWLCIIITQYKINVISPQSAVKFVYCKFVPSVCDIHWGEPEQAPPSVAAG